MVVVLLIALQTALDALNVRVLPHRAWAQGISPTVVQVPGGPAIYYKYVLVDATAANEKFNLPTGAQSSFLGVSAIINASDTSSKLLLRLMTLPEDLFLLAVVWILRNMVLSTWKSGTDSPTPFIRGNARRLRWIAGLIGLLWFYRLWLPKLIEILSYYTVLTGTPAIAEVPPWYALSSWAPFGVMVLLLILARVFSHGARLQDDVAGLV
jgi:hypothetical protein